MSRLIIIACGRSGTYYTAKVLRRAGLDFGHEKLGADGGIGWVMTLPGYRHRWKPDDTILHQIREPWACISSMLTHNQKLWKQAATVVGPFSARFRRIKAAEYYVRHNCLCAELAEWTYRVEDFIPATIETAKLFAVVGATQGGFTWPARDLNHRRHTILGPTDYTDRPDLLAQIADLSKRFGYG